MVQQLHVLPEDQGSVLRTLIRWLTSSWNFSSKGSDILFWSLTGICTHRQVHTHTCILYINNNANRKKKKQGIFISKPPGNRQASFSEVTDMP